MFLFRLRDALWGVPMLALLLFMSGFFTVKTHFFTLHPIRIVKNTFGSLFRKNASESKKLLSSVATALGGTVGVGSITGVALALQVGGAGSIFWMWLGGWFGMALKYAEVFPAVKHRVRSDGNGYTGGTPYLLKQAHFPKLGILFALLCVFASFGVGNLAQVGAWAESCARLGISGAIAGLTVAAFLTVALLGGKQRIEKMNLVLVPISTFLYLSMTAAVVLWHLPALPYSLWRIVSEAFGVKPLCGGIGGSLLLHAAREGIARGVFSNEAGVGSSPLAHASSGESDPQTQGEWGAFEVLCDTFLVSTPTALALLCSGKTNLFSVFAEQYGRFGEVVFPLLMAVFAFASVLSWCYYSEVCLKFLRLPHAVGIYRVLTVLVAFSGAFCRMETLWALSDILNALMILPNLCCVFLYRTEITYKTEERRNVHEATRIDRAGSPRPSGTLRQE